MSEDSLEGLRQRLARFAADRDWDQFHSPKNLSMALIAEAAELIEHFQWLTEEQSNSLPADKLAKIAEELADIQIYLIRTADKLGVDLIDASNCKIDKNDERFPVDKVKGQQKRGVDYK
ncbi:MAG: nucleotide pyrophosphohydrolase [Gammaproteobacteria bacterium]|nr:MAG: nucleotide pyrophosphohydrolase [Gammaproteobacteria bacterium]